MSRTRRTPRASVVVVIVLVLGGTLVGLLVDRALGVAPADRSLAASTVVGVVEPELRYPPAGPSGGSGYSRTRERPAPAVRKFVRGRFDRQVRGYDYSRAQRRVITTAIRQAYRRRASATTKATGGVGAVTVPSRRAVWRRYRASDVCTAATWRPGGFDQNPEYDWWACRSQLPPATVMTDREIRGYICGGYVGIALVGALAGGVGAGWVFTGAGAAYTECFWGTFGY